MYDPVIAVRNSGSGIIDNSFVMDERATLWITDDTVYHGKVSVVSEVVVTYVLKTYSSVKLCSRHSFMHATPNSK